MESAAFLFPGQGSQYVGMGRDLYEVFPESKAVFDKADEILGFPLSQLCFAGHAERLTLTKNCQPAIFTMSIAAFEAFRSNVRRRRSDIRYAAGLSLGEYTALVAGESLGFEDGLRLVSKRAELMEEATKKYPGKMSAVLGLEPKVIEDICKESQAEVANINCPGQIVIAGRPEVIDKAKNLAVERGAKGAIDLNVCGAFHSSCMRDAAGELKVYLEKAALAEASIPVISNFTARPQSAPSEIRENLYKQMCSPVLWEESIRFIAGEGIKTFYEIGPGSVLKGLLRKIDSSLEVRNIGTKDDIININEGGRSAS
jgi:[acyl-carrier-protein] S-malonyltransferase